MAHQKEGLRGRCVFLRVLRLLILLLFADAGQRRNRANDASQSLPRRPPVGLAHILDGFEYLFEYSRSLFDVSQFTSSEQDRDDDFVPLLQELACAVDLDLEVVLTRSRSDADLLDFHLVAVRLLALLTLHVLEFAEIHDSANRGTFVRGDLDQVQPGVPRTSQRLFTTDDAQLLSVLRDQANFGNPDLLVHAILFVLDGESLLL